jgi:chromosome segregation ATPase
MSEQSLQAEAAPELKAFTDAVHGNDDATPNPATEGVKEEAEKDNSTSEVSNVEENEAEQKAEPKELTEADKIRQAMQKRIDRKTAATKALENQVSELQKKLGEVEQSNQQKAADNAPSEDDYDTWEAYQEALIEHKAEQRIKERETAIRKEEIQRKQAELQERKAKEFNTKVEEFRKAHPDYDEKADAFSDMAQDYARRLGNTPTLQAMSQVILDVDNAPAIIQALGSDPDLMDSLVDMSPVKAAFELFKIHESYSRPKETTQAPKPITPTKAGSSGRKSLSSMSASELTDWAKKQRSY